MTAPQPDLREALARAFAIRDGWSDPDARWTENLSVIASGGSGEPVYQEYLEDADSALTGPLAGPLADLIARAEKAERERDEAQVGLALAGPSFSRRRIMGERDAATTRAEAAEAEVGRRDARIAVLEAALGIALAFVDHAAGIGLSIDADDDTPEMDAADVFIEVADRLGEEVDSPALMSMVAQGRAALKPQEAEDGR